MPQVAKGVDLDQLYRLGEEVGGRRGDGREAGRWEGGGEVGGRRGGGGDRERRVLERGAVDTSPNYSNPMQNIGQSGSHACIELAFWLGSTNATLLFA